MLGCVGKFCIVAKPACQLLSANQTLIQVKDTKALDLKKFVKYNVIQIIVELNKLIINQTNNQNDYNFEAKKKEDFKERPRNVLKVAI